MSARNLDIIVADQKESITTFSTDQSFLMRDGYEECTQYLSHPNILLVSGLRRAGKSFFARQISKNLKCAYLTFEDERLIGFTSMDFNDLLKVFKKIYGDFDTLLLDEIQEVSGWELFVGRMREKYRIIVTGSNARLLGSEMATHLTGRYISIDLFPMNFCEFTKFRNPNIDLIKIPTTQDQVELEVLFEEYIKTSGVFDFHKFGKPFLRELFFSIISKDIIVRYGIKNKTGIQKLALLLIQSICSKYSLSGLSRTLKIKSEHTIDKYISYFQQSFLFFTLTKFSFKLKEQISSQKKIYTIDNCFISSVSLDFTDMLGKLLENTVAVHLKNKGSKEGYDIYYWSDYKHECDFVIKKGKKITDLIQVCHTLNFGNEEREISGLTYAMEDLNLKVGKIITFNEEKEIKRDGKLIKVIPAWKYLAGLE